VRGYAVGYMDSTWIIGNWRNMRLGVLVHYDATGVCCEEQTGLAIGLARFGTALLRAAGLNAARVFPKHGTAAKTVPSGSRKSMGLRSREQRHSMMAGRRQ
jgi:hypothetical protein